MSFTFVYSRANVGILAPQVVVETHLSNGLPQFTIVGLPETAVRESKDRVRSALMQSGFEFPTKRITVNLAPADLPKEGGRFDLPIAISILIAAHQLVCPDIDQYELAGELALGGALRPFKGVLPFALATQQAQKNLIIPSDNQEEAAWVKPLSVYAFSELLDVCAHLSGRKLQDPINLSSIDLKPHTTTCLSDICGQHQAKRALEISAAGAHSLLMVGPPGTGKTMLASRLNTILPPLSQTEALEVASLYSVSRLGFHKEALAKRPFRQPHHTASAISLVGGGRFPMPGEISLAHHGVLFLDELAEFKRHVLEVLREPLESGKVSLARAAGHAEYPANCQLVAAMNPCPCGYLGDKRRECHCTLQQIRHYRSKISGPLLDRIDMHIEVPFIDTKRLSTFSPEQEETTLTIRQRVIDARAKQLERQDRPNAKLTTKEIMGICKLDNAAQQMLTSALDKLGISARAYHRILQVGRTIADLSNSVDIQSVHLVEAIQFRKFDRQL